MLFDNTGPSPIGFCAHITLLFENNLTALEKAMEPHSSTPVLLPGKSHGRRSLVGYSPWGREESDVTERLHFHFSLSCIGEGNGNHSSVLAWRIPGMREPGGLPSMGSHRVGHDWSNLAAAAANSFSLKRLNYLWIVVANSMSQYKEIVFRSTMWISEKSHFWELKGINIAFIYLRPMLL